MAGMPTTVVWYRRDLRVGDHAPLERATRRGAVIPVFVLDRALLRHPETGVARVEFMLATLQSLAADLEQRGAGLVILEGDPAVVLPRLVSKYGADGIYAHTDAERVYGRVRDARVERALAQISAKMRWFEPPGATAELIEYPVFRKWWWSQMLAPLIPTPTRITFPAGVTPSVVPSLEQIGLRGDGKPLPIAGSVAAHGLLESFLDPSTLHRYRWAVSLPAARASSGLSPHLKFGSISPREAVQRAQAMRERPDSPMTRSVEQFTSRLRWGAGFTQRVRYLPQLELRSLYSSFDAQPWPFDGDQYERWCDGQTGFPFIDACARCLIATGGWLELNFRARSIYASFLGNLLGFDWRYGALHFMKHLIDGDAAIDHYQWAMQSGVTVGTDKTWTRIWHPGQVAVDRADPDGEFIRRWVPEVAHLPSAQIGEPQRVRGYPAMMLEWAGARREAVTRLGVRRAALIGASDLRGQIQALPDTLTPFAAQSGLHEYGWALQPLSGLQPAALELGSLDGAGVLALRSWLIVQREMTAKRVPARAAPAPQDDLFS